MPVPFIERRVIAMALLLCRQRAGRAFFHAKLNVNLWSEQELCYVIYNYPLLCLSDFLGAGLFDWISNDLRRPELADKLIKMSRAEEGSDAMLVLILRECNYYDTSEIMDFARKMAEYKRYSGFELLYREGRALYEAGNYNAAYERMESAIRHSESEYRKKQKYDDKELRSHNERKADLYCDMAAIKMQMLDEKSAVKLLEISEETCKNERAAEMLYLITGRADISMEKKAELDRKKKDAISRARESDGYKRVLDILEGDPDKVFSEAGSLALTWKNSYRKL